MYEEFFQLTERPFPATPSVDSYFATLTAETARLTLERCVRRGEGAALLVGPSGFGKTLLCRVLARRFRETFRVIRLAGGDFGTPRALLQSILFDLELPYRGRDEHELRLELHGHLNDSRRFPRPVVLMADEAHGLRSRVLEEIRLLMNIDEGFTPKVRVVLAGDSLLEERLAVPRLNALNQRVTSRCYLESFERDETIAYVQSRLTMRSDAPPCPFSKEACATVHRSSEGIPRLVNQLADYALMFAYSNGTREITPELVERAWTSFQQLPDAECDRVEHFASTESDESLVEESGAAMIEFGALEDDEFDDELNASNQSQAALEDRRHNEPSHPVESFAAFDHSDSQSDDELVAHETTQQGEATQLHNEQSHPAALPEPTVEFGALHDEEFDASNEDMSEALNMKSSLDGDSSQEAAFETSDYEINEQVESALLKKLSLESDVPDDIVEHVRRDAEPVAEGIRTQEPNPHESETRPTTDNRDRVARESSIGSPSSTYDWKPQTDPEAAPTNRSYIDAESTDDVSKYEQETDESYDEGPWTLSDPSAKEKKKAAWENRKRDEAYDLSDGDVQAIRGLIDRIERIFGDPKDLKTPGTEAGDRVQDSGRTKHDSPNSQESLSDESGYPRLSVPHTPEDVFDAFSEKNSTDK
jgi:type II secretory pathway predicted ATPase ExeA